jgi:hypothetical protein
LAGDVGSKWMVKAVPGQMSRWGPDWWSVCHPMREYPEPGPGPRAEQAVDHLEKRRCMDQPIGQGRGLRGEVDVVGEGATADRGVGLVEGDRSVATADRGVGLVEGDRSVATVEPALGQPALQLGQLHAGCEEVGIVERPPQGGVAVHIEERTQLVELVGSEHTGTGDGHAGFRAGAPTIMSPMVSAGLATLTTSGYDGGRAEVATPPIR